MRRLLLLSIALLIASCATAPRPAGDLVDAPAAYDNAEPGAPKPEADWWRAFGDDHLGALIRQALAANQDLAAGVARVKQARAAVRTATAALLPQASGGASASSNSDNDLGRFSTSARADASYQLDLFGENRANRRAAKANYAGSAFDQDALALTIQTDVAASYFRLNALRSELEVAKTNLGISERIYDIVRVRYKAGAVSGFDMASQETAIANARARIPQLEQQVESEETALAVLLGRAPQGYRGPNVDILSLTPPRVDPGLPSDLLLRRPDLRAAEAAIAAADANVAAARAAFFPQIDLSAGVSAASLTGGMSVVGSLAGSLAQTIFSGGRLEGDLAGAKARVEERIANYRQATLNALRDVEVALTELRTAEARETQLALARDAADKSLALAEIRYKSGADDLTSLLNAQATYFSASDNLVQGRLDRLTASIDLFAAIGGGWGAPDAR